MDHENTFMVIFDDGYRDNLLWAASVLARYEIRPALFVVSDLFKGVLKYLIMDALLQCVFTFKRKDYERP